MATPPAIAPEIKPTSPSKTTFMRDHSAAGDTAGCFLPRAASDATQRAMT